MLSHSGWSGVRSACVRPTGHNLSGCLLSAKSCQRVPIICGYDCQVSQIYSRSWPFRGRTKIT
jgi:hypothetical protein